VGWRAWSPDLDPQAAAALLNRLSPAGARRCDPPPSHRTQTHIGASEVLYGVRHRSARKQLHNIKSPVGAPYRGQAKTVKVRSSAHGAGARLLPVPGRVRCARLWPRQPRNYSTPRTHSSRAQPPRASAAELALRRPARVAAAATVCRRRKAAATCRSPPAARLPPTAIVGKRPPVQLLRHKAARANARR